LKQEEKRNKTGMEERVNDKKGFLGEVGLLAYDLARLRKRPHSFANRGALSPAQWQAQAHPTLMEAMSCPFDPVPLDVRQEGRREGCRQPTSKDS